ncbi:MAG: alpha/beta hydrolase [Mizugakiibacter sp.]|uniref:alpha/beta hydrolase n=1 Tax=Mizugakiibacter sp. TaxID=1972610 RepID=UPI0031C708A2|nr:alpha/beta hydrolase [Xanthomonadaceae bacterium]
MKVRTRIALALLGAAVVIGGQWWRHAHEGGTNTTDAGPVAVQTAPGTLRLGTLTFTACQLAQKHSGATTAAYCAPFEVPENRDAPQGRRIALKLALVKSDAAAADSDLVVFLAGGPGQAATETWPAIADALAPLRKHRHVLLLDQRGTGGSNALSCKRARAAGEDEAPGFDPARIRADTRDCLAEVAQKADPRYYTTSDAVRDLEAVRQALGAPKFDLVGVSYGTRVAQQYLMRHPDGVRSAVLDSVVPNELALGEDFAQNLEAALKAQFAACTATPACRQRFGDPYATLFKLRDALRAQPQTVGYRDPVTFLPGTRRLDEFALAGLVRMFAYAPETSALLPLTLDQAMQGHYGPLMGQVRLLSDDLAETLTGGMQLSVICAEDADLLRDRPQDKDTLLGDLLVPAFKAQCEVWPHGARPADFHAPLQSAAPVLLLEGELDPVTPPRYGEQVLKGLPNGRLLVAKGQGHNVIGRGCMPRLVGAFVERLDAKALDASCLDALGAMPAFTDFNGAAP